MTEGTTTAAAESGDTLTRLEQEGEIAADYLEGLLDIADLDGDIDMDVEADRAAVSIVSDSSSRDLQKLVGRDGEVLEALQELTRLAVHRETGDRSRLMLDIARLPGEEARGARGPGRQGRGGREGLGRAPEAGPDDPLRAQGRPRRRGGRGSEERVRGRGAAALRRCAPCLTGTLCVGPVCVADGADVCKPDS